jgi:uncharacterized membrane protein
VTVGTDVAPVEAADRRGRRGPLALFRSPVATFLAIGLVVGVYLACVVPHFAGIDEPAHFYRSYQISTGTFLPKHYGSEDNGFSGACVPRDVIRAQRADSLVFLEHLGTLLPGPTAPKSVTRLPPIQACPTDPSQGFVTFSTFGSPVPYLPQAATIFVARQLGLGADGMLLAARFVVLAVYLTLVGIAIARTPRSKWAFCAVGLLPVALFQAAPSVSHDAFTTAMALLVVSSALRALDPPEGTTTKALLIEALVLSALLGFCKPTYIVLAGLYLLPLLGRRRRKDRWPLVFAPALGVLTTLLWNSAVGDLWKTDAGYFGIKVDDAAQRHALIHEPWDFAADLARAVYHQFWYWSHTQVTVGPSVTSGAAILAVLGLAIYGVTSLLRHRSEAPIPLDWLQRALVAIVFLAGSVLIAVANYLYWTEPNSSQVGGIQPRYFMPLLVLIPVAIGSLPFRWANTEKARIPVPVLLVPTLLVFCVILTFRMY